MKHLVYTAIFLLALGLVGCGGDDDPGHVGPVVVDTLEGTPLPNMEAELAAIWLSGELVAPTELYDKIELELDLIRTHWSDSLAGVGIPFRPPWEPARIIIGFTEDAYGDFLTGEYDAWDDLNREYFLDTAMAFQPEFRFVSALFEGRQNPEVLAAEYELLPEVRFAAPNWYEADQSGLLLWEDDPYMVYYFRDAWGDCNPDCEFENFWVFTSDSARVVYYGYFENRAEMPEILRTNLDSAWHNYGRQ